MNRNYIFTTDDLLSIWQYIADNDGEGAADRVVDQICEECGKLGAMPGIGHYRDDLLDHKHRF